MNTIVSVRLYVQNILKISGSGIKALIMDKETLSIINLVFPQSELAQNEIYIYERLDSMSKDSLKFVNAIFVVKPNENNIDLLCDELKKPRYGDYYIFFTNILNPKYLEIIAKSDPANSVKEIQEIYCDFYPLNSHLFTTNQPNFNEKKNWNIKALMSCSESIVALCMSFKLKYHIRYQKSSILCKELAQNISLMLDSCYSKLQYIYDSKPQCCLLIIDRRFDPISPLLFQQTYQAMIHELFNINNNVVKLSHIPDIPADLKEIILSAELDGIFQANMFLNYEDIINNMKLLMNEYQTIVRTNTVMDSIAEMKAVVDTLPAFRKVSNAVNKHITLSVELNKLTVARELPEQFEFERSLINNVKLQEPFIDNLIKFINKSQITKNDAVKLSMLFFICYSVSISKFKNTILKCLAAKGVLETTIKAVESIISYSFELPPVVKFANHEIPQSRKITGFLKYPLQQSSDPREHVPALEQIINGITKSQQFLKNFPTIDEREENYSEYTGLIIFIIGGVTYEESLLVRNINKSNAGLRIVLGGTTVLNSSSFIEHVEKFMS